MCGKRLRRKGVVFALMLAAAGVSIGSTFAYFSDMDTKANSFSTGGLDVDMKEREWEPEKDGDGKNLYPGYTVYKNPTVKNITNPDKGPQPCYVRVFVKLLDKNGETVSDSEAIRMIHKTIYYDMDFTGSYESCGKSTGLIEGRVPGYCLKELEDYPMVNPEWKKDTQRSLPAMLVFNYMGRNGNGILDIGEESTLFTNIVIPTDWENAKIERIGDFSLEITSQAIQSQSFSTPEEAWKALDKGETNGAAVAVAG